ncbi:MAG: hypothetical protein H7101_12425 [Deinococcales bacterium]|nr:hypothetical protein [Chitinophagaceae bacterium]
MTNRKTLIKILFATIIILMAIHQQVVAQVAPVGKYNTNNYAKDRKEIELVSSRMDSTQYLNDDMIAVGPEGRVSYGFEQWKQGFVENGAKFKSVKPVPGTYVLRVYNGNAAVKNVVVDVVFDTPKGDMAITVVRTETYIKQNNKWYFVAGQGTKKLTDAELAAMMK